MFRCSVSFSPLSLEDVCYTRVWLEREYYHSGVSVLYRSRMCATRIPRLQRQRDDHAFQSSIARGCVLHASAFKILSAFGLVSVLYRSRMCATRGVLLTKNASVCSFSPLSLEDVCYTASRVRPASNARRFQSSIARGCVLHERTPSRFSNASPNCQYTRLPC
jgi:hypothetical protein